GIWRRPPPARAPVRTTRIRSISRRATATRAAFRNTTRGSDRRRGSRLPAGTLLLGEPHNANAPAEATAGARTQNKLGPSRGAWGHGKVRGPRVVMTIREGTTRSARLPTRA